MLLLCACLSLAGGGILPEELRTEVHFLYTNIENNPEILTNHPKFHFGLSESAFHCKSANSPEVCKVKFNVLLFAVQSHLNCASLSHEYAVKYNSFCRDLHHITPLTRVSSVSICWNSLIEILFVFDRCWPRQRRRQDRRKKRPKKCKV